MPAGRLFAHGPLATCSIACHAVRIAVPRLRDILRPVAHRGLADEPRVARATAHVHKAAVAPVLATLVTGAHAASVMGGWYAYAAASDPDRLPYDLSFWRAGASVVGTAMATWLALRRSSAAVPVSVASAAVACGLGAVQTALGDSYVTRTWGKGTWRDRLFNAWMPAFHAVALPLSAVSTLAVGRVAEARLAPMVPAAVRLHWPRLRGLGLYYMVFALVGHWGEMLFCTGIKYGLIRGGYDRENHMLWDQWLFPFPAEGVVAVLMALLLYPAKNAIHSWVRARALAGLVPAGAATAIALAMTFVINQAVCTAIDYGTGMVANRNYELWDYRDMPYNFQGHICLQNSLVYGVLSTTASWWLYPRTERLLSTVDSSVLDGAFVALGPSVPGAAGPRASWRPPPPGEAVRQGSGSRLTPGARSRRKVPRTNRFPGKRVRPAVLCRPERVQDMKAGASTPSARRAPWRSRRPAPRC